MRPNWLHRASRSASEGPVGHLRSRGEFHEAPAVNREPRGNLSEAPGVNRGPPENLSEAPGLLATSASVLIIIILHSVLLQSVRLLWLCIA